MAKKTAEISIIFKDWVSKKAALEVLDKLGLLQYQRKRTDRRKNSLIILSILVPPLITEDVINKLNIQKEVVRARKI